ncbi:unnamed protein product [Prorocentrum cordatum]|uniref:Major facilitator superfamily (MFS) profile domain-containing protein n=1 Tax=Prorocentrum cordatum TaxID=2364126 RepID=A0ABN9WI35_9DINO|nr:unnamed protein product [Polarella glacialis]
MAGGSPLCELLMGLPGDEGEQEPILDFDPDEVIELTYGSGRYQLRALLLVGGIYMFIVPGVQIQVFVGPKMVGDAAIPAFTDETLSASQTLLFVGWGLGTIFFAPAADKVGRRPVVYSLTAGLILAYGCSVLAAEAGSVPLFAASMLAAGSCIPCSQVAYVLLQEVLPGGLRVRATVFMNVAQSLELGLIALTCGYVTKGMDWRLETMIFFAPLGLLLFGAPLVDESLHLLLMRGRRASAERLAAAIALANGVCPPPNLRAATGRPAGDAPLTAAGDAPAVDDGPLRSLLRAPLRRRLLLCCVCWTAPSLGYYGLSFSAGRLSPDVYLNIRGRAPLLAGRRGGLPPARGPDPARRPAQVPGRLLLRGGLLPPRRGPPARPGGGGRGGRAPLHQHGLLCSCRRLPLAVTVEAFPTGCRTTAMGLCNGVCRLLTLFAPLAARLPTPVACCIFSALCAAGAAATCALPETRDWRLSQAAA